MFKNIYILSINHPVIASFTRSSSNIHGDFVFRFSRDEGDAATMCDDEGESADVKLMLEFDISLLLFNCRVVNVDVVVGADGEYPPEDVGFLLLFPLFGIKSITRLSSSSSSAITMSGLAILTAFVFNLDEMLLEEPLFEVVPDELFVDEASVELEFTVVHELFLSRGISFGMTKVVVSQTGESGGCGIGDADLTEDSESDLFLSF